MAGGVRRADALGERAPDLRRVGALAGLAVAAEHEDHVSVAVALAEELAVRPGVSLVEHFGPVDGHGSPCHPDRHEHALGVGVVDHVVDVVPVVVVRARLHRGSRRVLVHQRQVARRRGDVQPALLGERDGLDHREPLLGAGVQIAAGVLAAGAVEQLPPGVGQIEERLAVRELQEPSVRRHLEGAEAARGRGVGSVVGAGARAERLGAGPRSRQQPAASRPGAADPHNREGEHRNRAQHPCDDGDRPQAAPGRRRRRRGHGWGRHEAPGTAQGSASARFVALTPVTVVGGPGEAATDG